MAGLELALFLTLAAAGAVVLWRAGGALRGIAAFGLMAATGWGLVAVSKLARHAGAASAIAVDASASGSVGSGACRSCHPGEHASWHRSFHRTMTQVATPSALAGAWAGVKLEVEGRSVELSRRGDELWARLPDPDLVAAAARAKLPEPSASAPLVSRRVLLTTGSHHHQVYWVGGERGNELRLLPITYMIREQRFVARRDAFLQPPDAEPHAIRWNSNCIQCHATRGEPRHDETLDRFASTAAELGIACEACHGPGAAHVAKHHDPFTRFTAHLAHAPDPSIVNPARLEAERASEVCGQCHAYFVPRDEGRWWSSGFADFRPGQSLAATRELLVRRTDAGPDDVGPGAVDATDDSLFWGDGSIRVGGREWNGLRSSACFLRGGGKTQISCLSCHSMHDSEPDDQLRHGESVNAPCVRCHAALGANVSEHTHHAPASAGSSCVACHMPPTSYALFTAIRSHQIDSPSARATASTGRPNACNLCHLDQPLSFTAGALERWYPHPQPLGARTSPDAVLGAFASPTPRAVVELIAGDAATRAVVAAAFGRSEARRGAGVAHDARLLAELSDDPYAAVRKVACDSLHTLPGYASVRCDFVAPPEERRANRAAAVELARTRAASSAPDPSQAARDQAALEAVIQALLAVRDATPTTISE
jgi:predicted CXXCH cytochrome family protein